jgi:hypothetical protein
MHVTIDVGKSNYCITIMVLNVGGRERVIGGWRRLHNTEHHNLNSYRKLRNQFGDVYLDVITTSKKMSKEMG